MTGEEVKSHCLGLTGAMEEFPFSPEASVFKVGGKIFAISALEEEPLQVSLKVEPEIGDALRGSYDAIRPGYHLNKRHWVTVTLGEDAEDDLVRSLLEDSYDLVKPRAKRRRAT